jgi:hypothetical protein
MPPHITMPAPFQSLPAISADNYRDLAALCASSRSGIACLSHPATTRQRYLT